MSQSHQNHVKKEEADNPNRTRTVYLWNIIFLSCLTIAALLFAMLVYFRLRTRGTDGFRKLYTEDQIRQIREEESTRQSVDPAGQDPDLSGVRPLRDPGHAGAL